MNAWVDFLKVCFCFICNYVIGSSKSPSFNIGENSAIFKEHEAFIIDVKVGSTVGKLLIFDHADRNYVNPGRFVWWH